MSLIDTYAERFLYNVDVPMDFFNQNFIDFSQQYAYGVLNQKMNPMIVRPELLKPVSAGDDIMLVSFAADAFNDMYAEMKNKVATGQWEQDSIIPTGSPENGTRVALEDYHEEMTRFFQLNTPSLYKNKTISSFDTFLDFFQDLLFGDEILFSTFSGFLIKKRDVHYSGLTLDLHNLTKNDVNTSKLFMADPGLKRYMVLAKKYGFLVNRQAPWMLVADINSIPMLQYAANDALVQMTTKKITKRYFQSTVKFSFTLFVQYIVSFYNSLATGEPVYEYLIHAPSLCSDYERIKIVKEEIAGFEAEKIIHENHLRFLLLYFDVRFRESGLNTRFYRSVRVYLLELLKAGDPNILEFIERVCAVPRLNLNLPYGKLKSNDMSYLYTFEAQSAAAKLGCKGFHKMKNGRWMPCKTHKDYLFLTKSK